MNHTERIAETARRHLHLTRRLAKETIETYLELLAVEIAQGDKVDIQGIGSIQVVIEKGSGILYARVLSGERVAQKIKQRLRTKVRLFGSFKQMCYDKNESDS